MNTGIGDAVDLGWKLAAVMDGWGGDHLLASYDAERRPIGARNAGLTTELYLEYRKFGDDVAAIEEDSDVGADVRQRVGAALVRDLVGMGRTNGLQLGYRYEDSPICLSDGTRPDPDDPEVFVPSARPGARAPHAWLRDRRSILDLFGRGFVLLRLGLNAPEGSALESAAAKRGMPLKTVTMFEPHVEQLYGRRLVLVRPDGHVAWRGDQMPGNADLVIEAVRGAAVWNPVSGGCHVH
jgi:hypothetical protein